MIVIKNRHTGEPIFSSMSPNLTDVMAEAKSQAVSLANSDLSYRRMIGFDLSGMDFSGASFKESELSLCNLAGSVLVNVEALNTLFIKSNLDNVDATGMMADGADFRESSRVGMKTNGMEIEGAVFDNE